MFSHSKLYTRVLLGYLIPCLIFSVVTVTIYMRILNVQNAAQESDKIISVVQNAIDLQANMAEMQRAARGALLRPEDINVFLKDYEAAWSESEIYLRNLKAWSGSQDEIASLPEMDRLAHAIATVTRSQIELVGSGHVNEGIKEFRRAKSEELYKSFSLNAESFTNRVKEIETEIMDRLYNSIRSVIFISVAGLLLAIVMSMYLGNYLARRTSNDLKQAVSAIASSSAQIASTTAQHESATAQQSSAVTETTSALEEVVATARINAEQAESVTNSVLKVQETTRDGLDLVTHNEQDMVTMEETMGRIAEQIISLSEQAAKIGEIAHAVGELAAETNMLALNAAVEAARSGEQGRGFGVVAGEIRKLADQSKKSAERANQIVSEIQKATNGMVMTAEEAGKITHTAAESARQASAAFDSIIHLADSVVHSAQSVLQNSKQQAVALSQVDIAMKSINSGSGEISAGTLQIREGMSRLTVVANDLDSLV